MRRYKNMNELSHANRSRKKVSNMDRLSLSNNHSMRLQSNYTWNMSVAHNDIKKNYKHGFSMRTTEKSEYDTRYAIFEDKEDSIGDYTIFDVLKNRVSFRKIEYKGKDKLVEVDMDKYTIQNGPDWISDRRGVSIPYISK